MMATNCVTIVLCDDQDNSATITRAMHSNWIASEAIDSGMHSSPGFLWGLLVQVAYLCDMLET